MILVGLGRESVSTLHIASNRGLIGESISKMTLLQDLGRLRAMDGAQSEV